MASIRYPEIDADGKFLSPGVRARLAATLAPLGRTFYGRPLQPVTNRFALTGAGAPMSNGTDTGVNTQVSYVMTRPTLSVALVYSNISDFNTGAAPNNITVRSGVLVNGTWVPVYFNGRRDVIIEPDAIVVSDPVGAPVPAGTRLSVRTRVTVAAGERWPNNILTDNAIGDGVEQGTATADKTTTGTITASRAYGPAPFTVLSSPARAEQPRTLVGVGDSIMTQSHDTANTAVSATTTYGWGFTRRWAHANNVPFLNLGVIGDTVQGWVAQSGRKYTTRRALAADAGVVVVNFGRNDLDANRTLAQIQADLTATWEQLARAGAKVYQATICPKTTSTDNWATTGGQAVTASEAVRVSLNDWIRTNPTPLAGHVDTADTIETARNSGIWKATGAAQGYTTDGIHPAQAGHIAMSAAFPADLMN